MLSTHFGTGKKETTEEIEKLKTTADNLKDSTCKAEQLANEMVECAEIKELTTAIVNRLIEKIEVSEPQTIDGEKVQNIRNFLQVRWRNQLNFHNVPIIQEPLSWHRREPATGQERDSANSLICRS